MYEALIKRLKGCSDPDCGDCCEKCPYKFGYQGRFCEDGLLVEAADAIEKLLKVASAMHTWIFLHTGDEQAAYDECGLTDEMNAELGYGGQFVIEPPKEST